MPKQSKRPEITVRSTPPIKFKDRPRRSAFRLNLLDTFGFVPEDIIISKVRGESNKMVISAVVLPKEAVKNDKRKASVVNN